MVVKYQGFLSGSDGKEYACTLGPLGCEGPLHEDMATDSSILA